MDSQPPATSAALPLKEDIPLVFLPQTASPLVRAKWGEGLYGWGSRGGLWSESSPGLCSIWPFCGMSQLKIPSTHPRASLPRGAAGPEARAHAPHHSPASGPPPVRAWGLEAEPPDLLPSPPGQSVLGLPERESAGALGRRSQAEDGASLPAESELCERDSDPYWPHTRPRSRAAWDRW